MLKQFFIVKINKKIILIENPKKIVEHKNAYEKKT